MLREKGTDRGPLEGYPSASVIVPARNEEVVVEDALRSVLAWSYPGHLEVVAVDDRSTDRTGEVLARLPPRGRMF